MPFPHRPAFLDLQAITSPLPLHTNPLSPHTPPTSPPPRSPLPPPPLHLRALLPSPPTSPLHPPPQKPYPWIWRCHLCHTVYQLGVTRRCLEDGHFFCSLPSPPPSPSLSPLDGNRDGRILGGQGKGKKEKKKRKRQIRGCRAEFDYSGWDRYNIWRREDLFLKQEREKTTRGMVVHGGGRREEEKGRGMEKDCWIECNFPSECHSYRRSVEEVSPEENGIGIGHEDQQALDLIMPEYVDEGDLDFEMQLGSFKSSSQKQLVMAEAPAFEIQTFESAQFGEILDNPWISSDVVCLSPPPPPSLSLSLSSWHGEFQKSGEVGGREGEREEKYSDEEEEEEEDTDPDDEREAKATAARKRKSALKIAQLMGAAVLSTSSSLVSQSFPLAHVTPRSIPIITPGSSALIPTSAIDSKTRSQKRQEKEMNNKSALKIARLMGSPIPSQTSLSLSTSISTLPFTSTPNHTLSTPPPSPTTTRSSEHRRPHTRKSLLKIQQLTGLSLTTRDNSFNENFNEHILPENFTLGPLLWHGFADAYEGEGRGEEEDGNEGPSSPLKMFYTCISDGGGDDGEDLIEVESEWRSGLDPDRVEEKEGGGMEVCRDEGEREREEGKERGGRRGSMSEEGDEENDAQMREMLRAREAFLRGCGGEVDV